MSNFEKKRDKKVFEIILILKLIYIVLGIVAIISVYSPVSAGKDLEETMKFITMGSVVLILMSIYFFWISNTNKDKVNKLPKLKNILDMFLLILVFILVLSSTGLEKSGYKIISIFIVIIGALEFGKNYSLGIAISTSTIILFIDFITTLNKPELLRVYFEKDIVLISALFVCALILGMYVDTEKEHSKELQDLANKDDLTGLYNHRYFQEHLSNIIKEAESNNKEVSLLFMDIDYFKNYNDVNGHQSGDVLLKDIGSILRSCMRKNDIVARYGGEEFAVILPDTDEYEAIKIGEKIRISIQNTDFYGQENQPNKNITISIGVSTYPTKASTKHRLINTADDALYRAKSFNKNRVEAYHSILNDLCRQVGIEEETIKSLKTFINMINIKDRYTYGHTERVVIYSKWFSKYMNLCEEDMIKLQISAYLHDIGKLEIPEEVLNKREKLTDEEYQMFLNHPKAGVELIKNIKEFESFIPIILHHHEKYDGTGYPSKLKGEEIPYLSRMLSIADSFDAMTSKRPYNDKKDYNEGIKELRKYAGTQFDPVLVEEFILTIEKYKDNF